MATCTSGTGATTNQRNVHGKQFIDCFYDYHRNLSPEEGVGLRAPTPTTVASD